MMPMGLRCAPPPAIQVLPLRGLDAAPVQKGILAWLLVAKG